MDDRGYSPKPLMGKDSESRFQHVMAEFDAIARVLNEFTAVELRERGSAPLKPRVGMIAYADGTAWDPGSGEGLYVYKSGGWTFIV